MKNLDQMYRKRGAKVVAWVVISFAAMYAQILTLRGSADWWNIPFAVTVWAFSLIAGGLVGFHVTDDYRQRSNSDQEV